MKTLKFVKPEMTDADIAALRALDAAANDGYVQRGEGWAVVDTNLSDREVKLFALERGMSIEEADEHFVWSSIEEMKQYLYADATVVKGKDIEVTWYKDQTLNPDGFSYTYERPFLKEEFVYTRNGGNFIQKYDIKQTPYVLDTSEGAAEGARVLSSVSREYSKEYTVTEGIIEGKERREKLMDVLKMNILGLLMMQINPATLTNYTKAEAEQAGGQFIVSHYLSMQMFITDAIPLLIAEVQADTINLWLNYDIGNGVTIRDFIVSELTINQGE